MSKKRRRIDLLPWSAVLCAAAVTLVADSAQGRSSKPSAPGRCASFRTPLPEGVTAPKVVRFPDKPPQGRESRAALRGFACIGATVDIDGRLVDGRVLATDDEVFAQAFLRNLTAYRYEPARRAGQPVAVALVLEGTYDVSPSSLW